MKLDKFKSLTADITSPELPDNDYIKGLYQLPQSRPQSSVLPIIGTVALAILLTVGVSVWAIIGSGVRNKKMSDDPILPADRVEQQIPPETADDKVPSKPSDKKEESAGADTEKDEQPQAPGEGGKEETPPQDTVADEAPPDDSVSEEAPPQDSVVDKTPPHNSAPSVVVPGDDENEVGEQIPSKPDEPYDPQKERELSASRADAAGGGMSFEKSPLFNPKGNENVYAIPSFDIDRTGFVRAGTKLEDLKNKTLVLFTPTQPTWSYRDASGRTVSEFDWFSKLKEELGLNVSYTVVNESALASDSRRSILSGKQLDLLYASGNNMLEMLSMSRDITSLINVNDSGSSPGICKKTMDGYALGGGYRIIAPIGNVDVLWYNLSSDNPTSYWRKDKWDYERFRKYGNYTTCFVYEPKRIADVFSCTSGFFTASVDTKETSAAVINNWGSEQNRQYIEDIVLTVNTSYTFSGDYKKLYDGREFCMSATLAPMRDYTDISYYKLKLRWVPYPKNTNAVSGRYCAPSLGYGLLLPKKTVNEDGVDVALKFCELWASRATESILDNLSVIDYYRFTDDERLEYYDFCVNNTVAPLYLDMNLKLHNVLAGDERYDVAAEWENAAEIAKSDIATKLNENAS